MRSLVHVASPLTVIADFDRMLALIPARLYFPKDTGGDEDYAKRKKGFLKVSSEKSSKLAKKEARNQALKEKVAPSSLLSLSALPSSTLKTSKLSLRYNAKQQNRAQLI